MSKGNCNDTGQVYTYEYIGSWIRVTASSHRGYEDIQGDVVDETKNTFVIRDGEEKIVPKKGTMFEVEINGDRDALDGSKLTFRPEDRIKRLG